MENEINTCLCNEIIRLLNYKFSGGAKLTDLLVELSEWAFLNNFSIRDMRQQVDDIIKYGSMSRIKFVKYYHQDEEKIFIYIA